MKTQLLKSIITFCILNFAFYINSNAQIQQNNIRVVDTVYTPTGFAGGPLISRLWLPSITNGASVILAHNAGQSWDQLSLYGDFFASYGYVVLSIDYYGFFHSSGIPSLYPAPVSAFKTGIEFLRRNAIAFGGYTGKVAGVGFSQGAFTIAQAVTWDNDDSFFNTDPSVNDHLDAFVCYYGLYDNLNHLESPFFSDEGNDATISDYFSLYPALRATKGNPVANISNITSPALLYHGTSDQVWNFQQSVELNDSLIARGKSSKLILLQGRDHIFDLRGQITPLHFSNNQFSTDGEIAHDTTLAFIGRTLQVNNVHCPYNKSYWKNHPALWNNDAIPMMLGTANSYNKTQLLSILNSNSGDVTIKLAQDLISAKLNLANNTWATPIVSTIVAADNLIRTRAIPVSPAVASNSAQGNQFTALSSVLQLYNNGTLTPNCSNSGNRMAENSSLDNFSMSIYPNPISNYTTISFSLSQSQKVSLKIFDVSGRLVSTLADKIFEAGENELVWSANEVNAGIYFLQFQSAETLQTEKLIVTK